MPKTTTTTINLITTLTLNGKDVGDSVITEVNAITQDTYEKAVRAAFRKEAKGGLEYWKARTAKKADGFRVFLSESATDADKKAFEAAKAAADAAREGRKAAKAAAKAAEAKAKEEAAEKARAEKAATKVSASKGASVLFGSDTAKTERLLKVLEVLADKLGIE